MTTHVVLYQVPRNGHTKAWPNSLDWFAQQSVQAATWTSVQRIASSAYTLSPQNILRNASNQPCVLHADLASMQYARGALTAIDLVRSLEEEVANKIRGVDLEDVLEAALEMVPDKRKRDLLSKAR